MNLPLRITVLTGLLVGLGALPAAALQNQQTSQGTQQTQKPQTSTPPTGAQPAQQTQSGQQGQSTAQQTTQPAQPKMDPAEEKAYETLNAIPASQPEQVITSGEAFLKKYPNSVYLGDVYAFLTKAYFSTDNIDKVVDTGEKALKYNSKNVDVLSILAYTISREYSPGQLGAADKLAEGEQDAKQALALLPTIQKPTGMTDEEFAAGKNTEEALCHSGLGLIYGKQNNLAGMVSELELAVKLESNPNPVDQFLLGFAYSQVGRYSDAIAPLTACAASSSTMADKCKGLLDQAKKNAAAKPKP